MQTIPALSDSNRILRDERDRLKLQVENFQTQLKENRDQMIPMQEQLKVLQEKIGSSRLSPSRPGHS